MILINEFEIQKDEDDYVNFLKINLNFIIFFKSKAKIKYFYYIKLML